MYVNHYVGLATRSPDPSIKVGSVIIDKECRLLAQGYNGEINTGEMREGAVDVNMKIHREVVYTKVLLVLRQMINFCMFAPMVHAQYM